MEKNLFGGKINLDVFDFPFDEKLEIIEKAYRRGLSLQKIFNFFDEESELSELNRKRELKVSDELRDVLKLALKFSKLSRGKYDFSWGKKFFDRKNGFVEREINCSYKDIKIKGNFVKLLNKDVLIDLGSVAKGYITDKIVSELKNDGAHSGFVDSRGDVKLFGDKKVKMNIEHPRRKGEFIYSFEAKNVSVATSGDYKQFYGSYNKSHILNKNNLISVTVMARDLAHADLFATLISVMDEKDYKKFLKKRKNIKVITVDNELKLEKYNLK